MEPQFLLLELWLFDLFASEKIEWGLDKLFT